MRNARIEQVGKPQTVYDHPRSPFVYEFLGNVNKLHAGKEIRYVRPHEIDVLFAAEFDPATDTYTGQAEERQITFLLSEEDYGGVIHGFVSFGQQLPQAAEALSAAARWAVLQE